MHIFSRDKITGERYENAAWGFAVTLGEIWYEPKGFMWRLMGYPTSSEHAPIFMRDDLPMRANIQIGPMSAIPAMREQHDSASLYLRHTGWHKLGEDYFVVLGESHYVFCYLLRNRIPTAKYSLVFQHPTLHRPIEFAFTISVYSSRSVFEEIIGESDGLVRSFTWLRTEKSLMQGQIGANTSELTS